MNRIIHPCPSPGHFTLVFPTTPRACFRRAQVPYLPSITSSRTLAWKLAGGGAQTRITCSALHPANPLNEQNLLGKSSTSARCSCEPTTAGMNETRLSRFHFRFYFVSCVCCVRPAVVCVALCTSVGGDLRGQKTANARQAINSLVGAAGGTRWIRTGPLALLRSASRSSILNSQQAHHFFMPDLVKITAVVKRHLLYKCAHT